MKMDDYQRLAARTIPIIPPSCRYPTTDGKLCPSEVEEETLIHGALKLSGEVGELTDQVGKWYGQGHDLDQSALILELGDVLWHVAEIATALRVDLSEVAERNLCKLESRYPVGFEVERSLNRSEQHRTFVEALDAD